MAEQCEACGGRGWEVVEERVNGEVTLSGRRCDICKRFAYDADARQAALAFIDSAARLLDASVAMIERLDHITTDEFSTGGEWAEREALRAAILAADPPQIEEE